MQINRAPWSSPNWVGEMALAFTEGKEYTLEEQAEWSSFVPSPGTILEVDMESTDRVVDHQAWAAFFIKGVANEMDGSHVVEVYYMGCEYGQMDAELAGYFGRGSKHIHLCLSKPCIVFGDSDAIHATRVRLWNPDNFIADYVGAQATKSLKAWRQEVEKEAKPKRRARAPPKEKADGKKAHAGRAKPGAKPKTPAGKPSDAAKRDALRAKLKALRGVHGGREEEKSPVEIASGSDEKEGDGSEEESTGYSPSETLYTGTQLSDKPKKKEKKKERHRSERDREIVPYEATKGAISKGWNDQLLNRALAVKDVRDQARKKAQKKKGKKDKALSLLKQILMGGSDKSRKQDKKSKKKKGRKRKRLEDGVIVSSSRSSEDNSSDREESGEELSSEEDLEAPMKKRSRDAPGSVLSLLTEHVRTQMEQEALMEVGEGRKKVTSGVKVATYFNLHIKPAYGHHLRELRELYMLAMTIDLLRKGDLARVGDSLSARFMAIHQSLVDQSWGTARHMELFPLEETTAASSALVLASRKHSRLVDKVQGKGAWQNQGGGRGKGSYRSDWAGWSEGPSKGKKGKGGAQKGKGKGKGAPLNSGDKAAAEWERNKDKPEATK